MVFDRKQIRMINTQFMRINDKTAVCIRILACITFFSCTTSEKQRKTNVYYNKLRLDPLNA